MALKVSQVLQERMVPRVLKERKVIQDLRDLLVRMVNRAEMVREASMEKEPSHS
jgi:hypothetical protein